MNSGVKVTLVVMHGVACMLVGYFVGSSKPPEAARAVFAEYEKCRAATSAWMEHAMALQDQRNEVLRESSTLHEVIREQTKSIKNLDGALAKEREKPPCDGGIK